MKWNSFYQPLGQCDLSGGFAPTQKRMLPAVIMAASALGSAAFSGLTSASARRKEREALRDEGNIVGAEKRRKLNESYLDTLSGQNLIRKFRQEGDRIYKREAGAAKVTGATERAAMAKAYNNNQMAEAMSEIAAKDQDRKDLIESDYNNYERGLRQKKMALDSQAAADAAAVGSQLVSGLGSAASAYLGTYMGSPAGGGVTAGEQTSQLQDMGGGSDFENYLKNYVKNTYKVGGKNFLTKESPLFTTDYKQFFGLN